MPGHCSSVGVPSNQDTVKEQSHSVLSPYLTHYQYNNSASQLWYRPVDIKDFASSEVRGKDSMTSLLRGVGFIPCEGGSSLLQVWAFPPPVKVGVPSCECGISPL